MSARQHQARGLAALARDANPRRRAAVGIRAGFQDADGAGGSAENWRAQAECAKPGRSANAWFPVGNTGPALLQIQTAKDVCNHECPVRDQCLRFALTAGMTDGVWGGMSEDERKAFRRRVTRRRLQGASKAEAQAAKPQNGPRSDVTDSGSAFPADEAAGAQRGAGDARGPLQADARDAHSATGGSVAVPASSETPQTPSDATEATAGREAASDA